MLGFCSLIITRNDLANKFYTHIKYEWFSFRFKGLLHRSNQWQWFSVLKISVYSVWLILIEHLNRGVSSNTFPSIWYSIARTTFCVPKRIQDDYGLTTVLMNFVLSDPRRHGLSQRCRSYFPHYFLFKPNLYHTLISRFTVDIWPYIMHPSQHNAIHLPRCVMQHIEVTMRPSALRVKVVYPIGKEADISYRIITAISKKLHRKKIRLN